MSARAAKLPHSGTYFVLGREYGSGTPAVGLRRTAGRSDRREPGITAHRKLNSNLLGWPRPSRRLAAKSRWRPPVEDFSERDDEVLDSHPGVPG